MKLYSQLEVASLENLGSDPALLPLGRFYYRTDTDKMRIKLSGGVDYVVMEAKAATLTNKTFTDSTTFFQDDGDNTKKFQFQLSGFTTGNTWTLTPPNATTSLLGMNIATTKGDLIVGTASNTMVRKGAGTNGYVLSADSTQSDGLLWIANPTAINPNRIINGDMRFDQRAEGSPTTIANGVYYLDRFVHQKSNAATTTVQRLSTTPPANFTHYMAIANSVADASVAAGDYELVCQKIEGLNVADFDFGKATAKSITLSFWVKATKTGTSCVVFENNAGDRSYVAEYTISVTNTWEFKTITIAGDTTGTWVTDTGCGLLVRFALMCGSTLQKAAGSWGTGDVGGSSNQINHLDSVSNVFNLTGVKLESGSIATAWFNKEFSTRLAKCERYYEKTYDAGTIPATNTSTGVVSVIGITAASTTTYMGNTSYRTTKRVSPTVAVYSVAGTASKMTRMDTDADAGTGAAAQILATTGFRYVAITTGIAGTAHSLHYTASAEI